jgi:hypothetical protein
MMKRIGRQAFTVAVNVLVFPVFAFLYVRAILKRPKAHNEEPRK